MEKIILSCLESRIEENQSVYSRFLLGPFLSGHAVSIATALRRALLSEVKNIAITALHIQGITHEFSTIVGVRESVLELSLNFQQVILSNQTRTRSVQVGYLHVQGPAIVYANDLKLPDGIECVNPTQYIATLSTTGFLVVKFLIGEKKVCLNSKDIKSTLTRKKIEQAKRYSTQMRTERSKALLRNATLHKLKPDLDQAEEGTPTLVQGEPRREPSVSKAKLESKAKLDFAKRYAHAPVKAPEFDSNVCLRTIIPLEPIFTPVYQVNFTIERDDLSNKVRERVIMEVWSNGSIHPRQAIHEAALSTMSIFSKLRKTFQLDSHSSFSAATMKNSGGTRQIHKTKSVIKDGKVGDDATSFKSKGNSNSNSKGKSKSKSKSKSKRNALSHKSRTKPLLPVFLLKQKQPHLNEEQVKLRFTDTFRRLPVTKLCFSKASKSGASVLLERSSSLRFLGQKQQQKQKSELNNFANFGFLKPRYPVEFFLQRFGKSQIQGQTFILEQSFGLKARFFKDCRAVLSKANFTREGRIFKRTFLPSFSFKVLSKPVQKMALASPQKEKQNRFCSGLGTLPRSMQTRGTLVKKAGGLKRKRKFYHSDSIYGSAKNVPLVMFLLKQKQAQQEIKSILFLIKYRTFSFTRNALRVSGSDSSFLLPIAKQSIRSKMARVINSCLTFISKRSEPRPVVSTSYLGQLSLAEHTTCSASTNLTKSKVESTQSAFKNKQFSFFQFAYNASQAGRQAFFMDRAHLKPDSSVRRAPEPLQHKLRSTLEEKWIERLGACVNISLQTKKALFITSTLMMRKVPPLCLPSGLVFRSKSWRKPHLVLKQGFTSKREQSSSKSKADSGKPDSTSIQELNKLSFQPFKQARGRVIQQLSEKVLDEHDNLSVVWGNWRGENGPRRCSSSKEKDCSIFAGSTPALDQSFSQLTTEERLSILYPTNIDKKSFLSSDLANLSLSLKTYTFLKKKGKKNIASILEYSPNTLFCFLGGDEKMFHEIEKCLLFLGLSLTKEIEQNYPKFYRR